MCPEFEEIFRNDPFVYTHELKAKIIPTYYYKTSWWRPLAQGDIIMIIVVEIGSFIGFHTY